MTDGEVVALLHETQANLVARGIRGAAEAVGQAIAVIQRLDGERHAAVIAAKAVHELNGKIESLNRHVAFLNSEVAKAQAETRLAQVPRAEEQAAARKNVRDVLRPFLKEGEQGVRMVALTIRQALDEKWGKEELPPDLAALRKQRLSELQKAQS